MLLVDRPSPERLAAVERELANVPGVASTAAGGRAGDDALVTGHAARERRRGRGRRARDRRVRPRRRRHRRRRRGRRAADRRDRRGRPRPRGADRVPAAAAALAAVLPRPRDADAARRRRHDRARHVPRAVAGQPRLRPERVRAQPRDRARARPRDRLHAVPRHPLSARSWRARAPRRGAIAATMATAGRTVAFSAATVSAALITLVVFPQDFLKSMGIAGAIVAVVAALASLVISPGAVRDLGRPAGAAARPRRGRRGRGVVPARPRRDAPRQARGAADRARDARAVAARADRDLVGDRLLRDPRGEERPHGRGRRQPRRGRQVADGDRRLRAGRRAGRGRRRSPTASRGVEGVERVAPVRDLGSGTWQVSAIATGDPSGPGRPGRRRGDPRDPGARSTCASAAAPRSSSTSRRRSARGCCSRSRCSSGSR